jgi:exosortase D (VPLPA-CTERM-specific)
MLGSWQAEDYNYCFFIPPIVAYLLWEKRAQLGTIPVERTWYGLAPLGIGIALFWLGELGGEYYTLYLASWFVAAGFFLGHMGWRRLKTIAFPVLFSIAMFPFPNFINYNLTLRLKLLSSQAGVAMLRLCGMSAYREGNVIDLGFTRLQVVDACSGLRFFFPLIVLAVLLAYFFKAGWWKRLLLVLAAIPLSVITNGLRLAMVGILYQFWGPRVSEGFFHDFSGWFIFMLSLGFLVAEMWAIKKLFPERRPVSAAVAPAAAEVRVSGYPVSGTGPERWLGPPQSAAAILLLGATLALAQGVDFREKIPIKRSFDRFPLSVGEWRGGRTVMEPQFRNALKFSDYALIDFKDRQGREVGFYVAYYASQRKGESIHSPETCLPGGGWVFEESGQATIARGGATGGSMQVRRAFIYKSGVRELTYYWFPQRGRVLTSIYQLKLFGFWDALTRHRTDGALVRLITPVYETEKPQDAEIRLQAFTREIVPVLAQFLPE